jgi:hypothetical protein
VKLNYVRLRRRKIKEDSQEGKAENLIKRPFNNSSYLGDAMRELLTLDVYGAVCQAEL